MKREEIEKLFNYMINVEAGDNIHLPFVSKGEADSARVSLYRQKGLYKKLTGNEASFSISKNYTEKDGYFYLILKKERSLSGFFVERNGKIVDTVDFNSIEDKITMKNIEEELDNAPEDLEDTEIIKSINALREEGNTDEDIEEMFKNDLPRLAEYKWKELIDESD